MAPGRIAISLRLAHLASNNPPGSNNKLQDLRKGYFTTTSEAIPKRHKVAMERYRMFRRTFEERRRGLDQLPNQQDVSDMLLNSAKGDRRRSQFLLNRVL
ncbi:MAG: hypothetical protein DMF23_11195 [Verrucomicrobia bacterium]|nr:MAG: hypothetical protein DMF23_11195 [Verrucomicrobiota bacterium]